MFTRTTELMLQVKAGDHAAFDQLVEQLRAQAFQVAHGLVGSREDALELAQEAFLKTYRARADFRPSDAFLPWFHSILRNTCYSFLRKRGRIAQHSLSEPRAGGDHDDDEAWPLEDDGPAPGQALESDERARAFWRAFRRLGGSDREILALRHFKELSYQDIADSLGIPIGTVMSRLFHARRKLREALGDTFEEDFQARHGAKSRPRPRQAAARDSSPTPRRFQS